MNGEKKEINRRTFQEVTLEVLSRIRGELDRELAGKLKRAEMFRKTSPGKARDYEMQADGFIDSIMTIDTHMNAIQQGGKL